MDTAQPCQDRRAGSGGKGSSSERYLGMPLDHSLGCFFRTTRSQKGKSLETTESVPMFQRVQLFQDRVLRKATGAGILLAGGINWSAYLSISLPLPGGF